MNNLSTQKSAVYASCDSDWSIKEDATIKAFDTLADAKAWLFAGLSDEDAAEFEVASGDFSDCWIKAHVRLSEVDISPFSLDDLNISEAGSHPGGNCLWITPRPEIFILRSKETA